MTKAKAIDKFRQFEAGIHSRVRAYALLSLVDGKPCGRLIFQRSNSNQFRCFLHLGYNPIAVSAWTTGGGYGKNSASLADAVEQSEAGRDERANDIRARLMTNHHQLESSSVDNWLASNGVVVLNII
jgi:hypothetical protein